MRHRSVNMYIPSFRPTTSGIHRFWQLEPVAAGVNYGTVFRVTQVSEPRIPVVGVVLTQVSDADAICAQVQYRDHFPIQKYYLTVNRSRTSPLVFT